MKLSVPSLVWHILLVVLLVAGFGLLFFKINSDTTGIKTDVASLKTDNAALSGKVADIENKVMTTETKLTAPEAAPANSTSLEFLPVDSIFFSSLKFSYPKGWFVDVLADDISDTVQIKTYPGEMILDGGVGCEPYAPCTNQGAIITVTTTDPKEPLPTNLKQTKYASIKEQEDPCVVSAGKPSPEGCFGVSGLSGTYYYVGKKATYIIKADESQYLGDFNAVIDGFLASLHELSS